MREQFSHFARKVNDFCASPLATILAFVVIILWAVTGPFFHFSDLWQLTINTGTSISTFLLVFIIANAQNRDTTAINLKLDELILAVREADDNAIGIEYLSEEEVRQLRAHLTEQVKQDKTQPRPNDFEKELDKNFLGKG